MKADPLLCAYCGKPHGKCVGHVNRSAKIGAHVYCNRECAGRGRRKSDEEKRARFDAYQKQYREQNAERIKSRKAAYHQRTYDPEKARIFNAQRMAAHVEYCRQPEYQAKKNAYDRQKRADEYGEFNETFTLLLELEKEICSRATGYDRRKARGYYDKINEHRRRERWMAKNSQQQI